MSLKIFKCFSRLSEGDRRIATLEEEIRKLMPYKKALQLADEKLSRYKQGCQHIQSDFDAFQNNMEVEKNKWFKQKDLLKEEIHHYKVDNHNLREEKNNLLTRYKYESIKPTKHFLNEFSFIKE